MIPLDDLLKPVSEEAPCGPDLSYDPRLQHLESLVQGTPESQVGDSIRAAEDPDWKELRKLSLELLGESKHLSVGVILTLSLLKLEGMQGFRDGLNYLAAVLKQFWPAVYPQLDPTDNNDPTQRINTMNNLSASMGTFGDPYRFLERLQSTPLGGSSRSGRASLKDIRGARGGGEGKMDPGQVDACFKDTPPEALQGTYDAITQSLEKVKEIDQFLTETVGSTDAASFDELLKTIKEMEKAVAAYLAGGSPAAGDGSAESGDAGGAGPSGGAPGRGGVAYSGAIQSREDVVKALAAVCEFYRRYEPSSPVPMLLRRAQRLATMSFIDIIGDLTPEALEKLKIISGPDGGSTPTPPGP